MTTHWKRVLAASLAVNVLLVTGLWKKTEDTRAYYRQQMGYWFASAAPEPPAQQVAAAPSQPTNLAEDLSRSVPSEHAYHGEAGPALDRWRQAGREAFAANLRYRPTPFSGQVIVAARTEFPTFTREKLYLKVDHDVWLPAYMLVPKGIRQPRPAVLAMPGHDGPTDSTGRGAASIAGRDTTMNYMRAFGLRLAEAGYVVLAIDVAGIGELKDLNYMKLVREGTMVGYTLKRLMLEEVHEAMDYLVKRPEVDPARVGTMGMSLGGELAMFSGLLDPRVKFVVSSGFFYSYRDYNYASAASLFIPGVLRVGDIPDLAAMLAPTPMLVQVGQYDVVIDAEKIKPYYEKTRQAYTAAGAADALSLDVYPDGHVMGVAPVLDWLKKHVPVHSKPL